MHRTGSRPPNASQTRPRSISCTALEWERARAMAREQGVSIAQLMVTSALDPPAHLFAQDESEEVSKAGHDRDGEALVLTADEQRALYDAILKLTDGADAAMLPTPQYRMNMQDCIRFLFEAKVDDLARAGRGDDIYRLFGKILDDRVRRQQVQRWIETRL